MLEERGYARKQATINGENGKAWHGIRLKSPKELKAEMQPRQMPSETPPRKPNGKTTLDGHFDTADTVAG
jgi:hypothetical protein